MFNIASYLEKFRSLSVSNDMLKNTIVEVVAREAHVSIKREDIFVDKKDIFLKIKPIFKTEIMLKKKKILAEIDKIIPQKVYNIS